MEPVPGGVGQQVFGKCRMADKDIQTLLATSGRTAFFEPSRGFEMGPVTTEWQQQRDDETPGAHLARCLTLTADYGLVSGRKQLGKRMKHDPSISMQRLWLVQMVPGVVTVEQLSEVLAQSFTDVEMVHQRRRGSKDFPTKDYTFRAKSAEQAHSIALPLIYAEEKIVLWVRHAPPKRGPQQAQQIGTSWSRDLPLEVSLGLGRQRRRPRMRRARAMRAPSRRRTTPWRATRMLRSPERASEVRRTVDHLQSGLLAASVPCQMGQKWS